MTITERIPLAPLTTFGVGGAARFFAAAETAEDVCAAIRFADERALPLTILGGGSNVLIADEGIDGVVLAPRMGGIAYEAHDDGVVEVVAGAGVLWDDLVRETLARGLAGLECLSGVPGTVGGAVVANIGAYGAQASDTLVRVEAVERASCARRAFTPDECAFSYHDSRFAREPGRFVIIRAAFALRAGAAALPRYADYRANLADELRARDRAATPANVRDLVLDIRERKGTLAMPGRSAYRCAGSFFHMPQVSHAAYERVRTAARALDAAKEERLRPWSWEQPDGTVRLAPGFLLEYTPFTKGYVRGAVGISPKHTLSIIALDGARAHEIAALAHDMQHAVERTFGVVLVREVEYLGAFAHDA